MNTETPIYARTVNSPFGPLRLRASATGLVGVGWPGPAAGLDPDPADADGTRHPILTAAAAQLAEYFAGDRVRFDLALDPRGTDFQRRVWAELIKIPYGETRTYGQLAQALGQPGAARAVGAANGRNPLGIVVPCHRVIATGGALSGFAGGVAMKRALLDLERRSLSAERRRRSS